MLVITEESMNHTDDINFSRLCADRNNPTVMLKMFVECPDRKPISPAVRDWFYWGHLQYMKYTSQRHPYTCTCQLNLTMIFVSNTWHSCAEIHNKFYTKYTMLHAEYTVLHVSCRIHHASCLMQNTQCFMQKYTSENNRRTLCGISTALMTREEGTSNTHNIPVSETLDTPTRSFNEPRYEYSFTQVIVVWVSFRAAPNCHDASLACDLLLTTSITEPRTTQDTRPSVKKI